mgnify:CR=1 FL=1
MKLLTVVCNRDKDIMLLQAESISLFLEPCTHYIVINEEVPDINSWKELLQPYYSKHKLIILHYPLETYIPRWKNGEQHVGWHRANVLKFLAYKDIQDDYLILDSKNIFIKNTSIEDFRGQLGCGLFWHYIKDMEEKNAETFQYYTDVSKKYPKWICGVEMPFLFEKNVLETIEDLDLFSQWYSDQPVWPSEPIYYSFLISDRLQEEPEMFRQHWVYWQYHNTFKIPEETFIFHPYDIRVLGLHRLFLDKVSCDEKNKFNEYLADIGFSLNLPN